MTGMILMLALALAGCGGSEGPTDLEPGTQPPNEAPVAHLDAPEDGTRIDPRTRIVLKGSVTDSEDGRLVGTWSSDVDGPLGVGDSIRLDSLSRGPHRIRLSAADSGGKEGVTTVSVWVRPPGEQDATGPRLVSLSILPDPLNLTGGDTRAHFLMWVEDDFSGVREVAVTIFSTTSTQSHVVSFVLVSGSRYRGLWRGDHVFPHTAAERATVARGRWNVQIGLFDQAGNVTRYLPGGYPGAEFSVQ
jgi:hypothetical protein